MFFCDKSIPCFQSSSVVEQPELSNSPDKSILWPAALCVWSLQWDKKKNSVHSTVSLPSPYMFSLILFFSTLKFLMPSHHKAPPHLLCCVILRFYRCIVLHLSFQISYFCLLVLARGFENHNAALFAGFFFHARVTGLTTSLIMRLPWLFADFLCNTV